MEADVSITQLGTDEVGRCWKVDKGMESIQLVGIEGSLETKLEWDERRYVVTVEWRTRQRWIMKFGEGEGGWTAAEKKDAERTPTKQTRKEGRRAVDREADGGLAERLKAELKPRQLDFDQMEWTPPKEMEGEGQQKRRGAAAVAVQCWWRGNSAWDLVLCICIPVLQAQPCTEHQYQRE